MFYERHAKITFDFLQTKHVGIRIIFEAVQVVSIKLILLSTVLSQYYNIL